MIPKVFDGIQSFLVHIAAAEVAMLAAEERALKRAALLVEREAKGEIGHYQPDIGPFPAWAPLAESTEAAKAAKGYPADAPLLASGDMRKNIGHAIQGHEAVIGSPDDEAVYHEFGTSKMPPRPVFGPAVYKNLEKLHFLIGTEVVAGIIDGKPMSGGDDYFIGS